MAWRSSGTNNEELVNNLKRFGVISSMVVEEGFRNVDRKFFVPKDRQTVAHTDQPLKEGNVHISAPHIYGSVVEALELREDSSLSFLNAGSGTGYLTCIVASILGPRSSYYCVELHEEVIQHCKESIATWKRNHPPARDIHHIEIIHGNALEIDTEKGECALGFDRIYIGAAIDRHSLPRFKKLLKPGGIFVGPVEHELVKVIRTQHSPSNNGATSESREFTQQVLSGVRFASLLSRPSIETVISARIWNPSLHQYYPDSFRQSSKALLLCSNAGFTQPIKPQPKSPINLACMLPRALWLEILSYTHRDWFKAPQSEIEFLRRRLAEEQANSERINVARQEAETRCHLAEKERDVYRLLARRWKSRLNSSLGSRNEDELAEMENIEEAAAAMLLGGRDTMSILGFGSVFRRFRAHAVAFHGEEHDEDDSDEDLLEHNEADVMDEDDDEMNDNMLEDGEEDEGDEEDDDSLSMGSSHRDAHAALAPSLLLAAADSEMAKAIAARPQVRTVSIAEEDL